MMLTHTGSDRPAADLSRRNFLRASAVASGGLLTTAPDQCLHSAEADVRPPRRKSGFGPIFPDA